MEMNHVIMWFVITDTKTKTHVTLCLNIAQELNLLVLRMSSWEIRFERNSITKSWKIVLYGEIVKVKSRNAISNKIWVVKEKGENEKKRINFKLLKLTDFVILWLYYKTKQ